MSPVTLRDCNKDVSSHLKTCKVSDDRIENEFKLLLERVGTVHVSIYYYPLFLHQHSIPFCFLGPIMSYRDTGY